MSTTSSRDRTAELEARVRELECLYLTSELLRRDDLSAEERLRRIPTLLAAGLRHAGAVRVRVDDRTFDEAWDDASTARIREPIVVEGRERGAIEIAHRASRASVARDRALARTVADRAADMLERERVHGDREALEEQLRQSQKMEAIGRLAGGIAHDFNNLLTSIKGLSALALKDLPAGHPIRPDIQEIEKAASRAAALTRQLLAFSRKQMLKLEAVDLNAVVASLESMLRRLIAEHIELRTTYAPALPPVSADASQLEQVVMNLVVNAQQATRSGGLITIETGLAVVTDDPATLPPGDYALLMVSDTGVGIEPDEIDKVFEPFFTTKSGEGNGLGLATVFGIVKQGGGHVEVESRVGVGSTFRVYLPLAREPTSDERLQSAEFAAGADAGTETILLAEDDASVRRLVNRILERAGYRVLQAEDAGAALAVAEAEQGRIDLLLTDVVMPRMSGHELWGHVQRRWPGVRVLYMSGYTDNPVVLREAEDPAGAFLPKPFAPEALLAAVRRTLERDR